MKVMNIFLAAMLLSGVLGSGENSGAAASPTTRTDSGGGVTIKVTYLDSKTTDDLRFQVVLDTHSVNLDAYDLKSVTVLRDDLGNNYLPTAVENKGSGHHREATVVFPKVSSAAKRIEVVIRDVGRVKTRTFQWAMA